MNIEFVQSLNIIVFSFPLVKRKLSYMISFASLTVDDEKC